MRRIDVVALCVVVVLVFSALVVSGASAVVYSACVKKKDGDYTTATCETKAAVEGAGKFERVSPVGDAYTSKTGAVTLETPGVGKVACKKGTGKGEFLSETADEDVVTFSSCETGGKRCHSAGEPAGTIKTFDLGSELAENAEGEAEDLVFGSEGAEELSAEFECEGVTIRVRGSAGGVIAGDLGKAEKTSTVTFSEVSAQSLETEIVGLTSFLPSVELAEVTDKGNAVGVFAGAGGAAKILTVEKRGGPEAAEKDKVAASLEAGTKVQFVKEDGEVACTGSKFEGEVTSNPAPGPKIAAVIEITTFTLENCSSTVGGAGGVAKKVKIEGMPLVAVTQGTRGFKIEEKAVPQIGVEIAVETPAAEEIACDFRTSAINAVHQNHSGEMEIDQALNGFRSLKNCTPPKQPKWKAKYRPLQDVTKGRQIYIN